MPHRRSTISVGGFRSHPSSAGCCCSAPASVDPEIAGLCAVAQADPRTPAVTFGLALRLFADAHWSALAPSAPLRRWQILDVAPGTGLTTRALRIDERVLHFLAGVALVDERLRGFSDVVAPPTELSASQHTSAWRIAEAWARADEDAPWPVIQLSGNDPAARTTVTAAACAALGFVLHATHAADLPLACADRDVVARLWERETVLGRRALLLEDEDTTPESCRALLRFLETTQGFFVVSGREPLHLRQRRVVRIDVDRPSVAEQKATWLAALGTAAEALNGQLDRVATHFTLSPTAIRDASAGRCTGAAPAPSQLGTFVWRPVGCTAATSRPGSSDRTGRDVERSVLPPVPLQTLHSIAATFAAARSCTTAGDSALPTRQHQRVVFGASGTGKTMAAEVLANALQLDLYRIDLSAMVSKYIRRPRRICAGSSMPPRKAVRSCC